MATKQTAAEKAHDKSIRSDIVGIALKIGGATTHAIVVDHADGNTKTLDKLKGILPQKAHGKSIGGDILGIALQIGGAITQAIVADHADGNTKTLDKLKGILPEKDVLLAQAQALKLREREKTLEALAASSAEEE